METQKKQFIHKNIIFSITLMIALVTAGFASRWKVVFTLTEVCLVIVVVLVGWILSELYYRKLVKRKIVSPVLAGGLYYFIVFCFYVPYEFGTLDQGFNRVAMGVIWIFVFSIAGFPIIFGIVGLVKYFLLSLFISTTTK